MNRITDVRHAVPLLAALLLFFPTNSIGRSKILLPDLPCREIEGEAVLFGFDHFAFPFQTRLQTFLTAGKFHSIAVPHGPAGAHDEFVRFYGTVIRIEGKYHMWYYGQSGPEPDANGYGHGSHPGKALCYATSDDAINWVKPRLGLVDFNGSKDNNIVLLPEPSPVVSAALLYEPEDPRPERRFKMVYEAIRGGPRPEPCVAFSPDGLRWTTFPTPIGDYLEMAGITKFRGKYYVNGQSPGANSPRRKLVTIVSTDFEHWSPGAMGLNRSDDWSVPWMSNFSRESTNYEEVHLGAALWNRGNVLIGIYGQWHGTANGDRRLVTMDLGLTISHDAMHHVEPIPGFKFIASREQPGSPAFDAPALMQGQGMENVGDKTHYWYSLWKGTEGTGVRLATWDRDRLGLLRPFPHSVGNQAASAITCPVRASDGGKIKVFLNASGLGKSSNLKVNLLDATFRPVKGFTSVIAQNGLRSPVTWENGRVITSDLGECHVQVVFGGARPEDASLHALYLEPGD